MNLANLFLVSQTVFLYIAVLLVAVRCRKDNHVLFRFQQILSVVIATHLIISISAVVGSVYNWQNLHIMWGDPNYVSVGPDMRIDGTLLHLQIGEDISFGFTSNVCDFMFFAAVGSIALVTLKNMDQLFRELLKASNSKKRVV